MGSRCAVWDCIGQNDSIINNFIKAASIWLRLEEFSAPAAFRQESLAQRRRHLDFSIFLPARQFVIVGNTGYIYLGIAVGG